MPLTALRRPRDYSHQSGPVRRSVSQSVNQATRRSRIAMDLGRRILVVDDDEGMREAIESLLDEAGFDTTVYASAEALLAAGGVEGAMCVISDLKLPLMSGLGRSEEHTSE